MLGCEVDSASGVVELTVDGAITRADYEKVVAVLEAALARHDKLRVIETIRAVGHIDAAIWWQDVRWAFGHMNKFGRCAVVTDQGWVGSITRAVGALMPAEIRVFPLAGLDEGRAWVRED
ncbi:MAG: STAS/SEC14 domain-containing protein [Pseudomonadota bacterium]